MTMKSHLGTIAAAFAKAFRLAAAAAALVTRETEVAAALDAPVAELGIAVGVAAEMEQHVDRVFEIDLCVGLHFGLAS